MKSMTKLFLIIVIVPCVAYSQSTTTLITGLIIDSSNGQSIANAHIINQNTLEGTISNSIGYFQINANENDSLLISYISHKSVLVHVKEYVDQNLNRILISPNSIELDEVVLRKGNWQQFKLEFVQTEFKNEQSSEVTIPGVLQYKGPPIGFQPSLFTALNNPISFVHHYMNKKARQKRKTNRYKRIIQKSSYMDD